MHSLLMTPVILETPYRGDGSAEAIAKNKAYLNKCILDCLRRGETPYASHQMLTEALDDAVAEERKKGMGAGFAMHPAIPRSRVYIDEGVSSGMRDGVRNMLTAVRGDSIFRRLGSENLLSLVVDCGGMYCGHTDRCIIREVTFDRALQRSLVKLGLNS